MADPLTQTALLGVIGALAFFLRDVPGTLMLWLSRHLLSRLVVDSRDHFVFTTLAEYLEGRPGFAASNQITAHARRLGRGGAGGQDDDLAAGFAPSVHFSPAPGFHIFRDQGRWLMVHRDIQISQQVYERLTLLCFGRDPAWLRELVAQAVAQREDHETRQLSVYMPDSFDAGEWTRVRVGNQRALSSVVLRQGLAEDLLADIDRFLGARQTYQRLGIPWRRGYLLYGPPGTGKTSLVSALASQMQMNICTFSLASPLITDEKIHALLASVPRRSILLIEDVDAFFHQRDTSHDEVKLSFSGFLNALDGVATQEGTVMFMTTNHVARLDPALVRSGRIDRRIELGLPDAEQMRRIFLKFHDDPAAADAFVAQHLGQVLSPADVQDLLMRRYLAPSKLDEPELPAPAPGRRKSRN